MSLLLGNLFGLFVASNNESSRFRQWSLFQSGSGIEEAILKTADSRFVFWFLARRSPKAYAWLLVGACSWWQLAHQPTCSYFSPKIDAIIMGSSSQQTRPPSSCPSAQRSITGAELWDAAHLRKILWNYVQATLMSGTGSNSKARFTKCNKRSPAHECAGYTHDLLAQVSELHIVMLSTCSEIGIV